MKRLVPPWASAAFFVLASCRSRPEANPRHDAHSTVTAPTATHVSSAPTRLGTVVPVRAAEGSQPRWRYLAHGERPRGRERWRFDLTPRESSGEPATDGRTVYVTASRAEPEGPTDGEVYAFDLDDGTLRWHTPVGGLHGEPVELFEGVVLVDTIPHCRRRGAETPGVTTRPCEEGGPGGVVGLDASTGRELFRTSSSSDSLRARWTAAQAGGSVWLHDGASALRPITLPGASPGVRLALGASVSSLTAVGADLVYALTARNGATRIVRRTPGQARPRWERALPLRTHCPALSVGPVLVLPAFHSSAVTGAQRGLLASNGADVWTAQLPPDRVETCAVVDNNAAWQVIDGELAGFAASDGRRRAHFVLPAALTSDMAAAMDGVFYLSLRGRLAGVDLIAGHVAVSVETGAASCEGVVVWGGRGAMVTRDPGLVVGFD